MQTPQYIAHYDSMYVPLAEVPQCEIWLLLLRQAMPVAHCPQASSKAAVGADFLRLIGAVANDLRS